MIRPLQDGTKPSESRRQILEVGEVFAHAHELGMFNSGGPSGKDDLHQAVRTAVINKRAGGMGLISGRKRRSSGRWQRAWPC